MGADAVEGGQGAEAAVEGQSAAAPLREAAAGCGVRMEVPPGEDAATAGGEETVGPKRQAGEGENSKPKAAFKDRPRASRALPGPPRPLSAAPGPYGPSPGPPGPFRALPQGPFAPSHRLCHDLEPKLKRNGLCDNLKAIL